MGDAGRAGVGEPGVKLADGVGGSQVCAAEATLGLVLEELRRLAWAGGGGGRWAG